MQSSYACCASLNERGKRTGRDHLAYFLGASEKEGRKNQEREETWPISFFLLSSARRRYRRKKIDAPPTADVSAPARRGKKKKGEDKRRHTLCALPQRVASPLAKRKKRREERDHESVKLADVLASINANPGGKKEKKGPGGGGERIELGAMSLQGFWEGLEGKD